MMKPLNVVLAIFGLILVYLGPAGCLRQEAGEAELAEQEAQAAEETALIPPDLPREESGMILQQAQDLLTHYDDTLVFWERFLPPFPEGLLLLDLNRGDVAIPVAGGVHERQLSVSLGLEQTNDLDGDGQPDLVDAPGGEAATYEWVMGLNARHDIKLELLRIASDGTAQISMIVWLLDPIEVTDEDASASGESS